ncbi:MAG: hypothetical protein Q4A05_08965, partial [Ruminococcus sp.]|nr:hypothetical protein [Ruminococcus sp.]
MEDFVQSTRRWYRQGFIPRDAGELYACLIATLSEPLWETKAVFLYRKEVKGMRIKVFVTEEEFK